MVRVQPYIAVRPRPGLAARVASVPYDVVSTAEARALAAGNPNSFLHVVRSEIDLPPEADPYSDAVYAKARDNFARMLREGIIVRDPEQRMFVYRLVMDGREQTGLDCCCHIDDYAANRVRRHEKTRRDKEDDRTRHILTVGAQAGAVFCTYRDIPEVADLFEQDVNARPLFHFDATDGVTHSGWAAADPEAYRALFDPVEAVYIADGHHRAASAWRVGQEKRRAGAGPGEHEWFVVGLFPASQVKILPYNRVVRDLGGKPVSEILRRVRQVGTVTPAASAQPDRPGVFCAYLDGAWHRIAFDPDAIDAGDPVASLDVALLQERVLEPILGIGDVRRDKRIDFVGGIRGTGELESRVNSGSAAIAFSMHPTSVEQLLTVADAGREMPPKSTWFEPKLRSGLFVHEIEGAVS